MPLKSHDFMVPVEGIEPPTFGLQNRCSTAELNRQVFELTGVYPVLTEEKPGADGRCAYTVDVPVSDRIATTKSEPHP